MSEVAAGAAPKPGFMSLPASDPPGFNALCGPIWVKAEGDKLVGGFRVEQHHCNPMGICHGGMLATFCDLHMGIAAQFEGRLDRMLPTITLSVDYMAPAPRGIWIEARVEIMKMTRGMVFTSETMFGDGAPVAHARGIYKIPSAGTPAFNLNASLRAMFQQAARSLKPQP